MTSVFRAVAVLTLLLCVASPPSLHAAGNLSASSGETVVLDGALVQAVYEPYVFVSDIWGRWGSGYGAIVPVYVNSASAVPRWATVRITGRNATINSTPVIIADSLQIYVTETGNLSPPLPPGVDWSYFQNVDVGMECEGLTSLYSQASQYPQNKAAPFDDAQGARRTPDSGGRFTSLSQGTAGTIPYAKSLENSSSSGTLSGKVLTAKLGTYFYIEEPDRSSGIRVNATPPSANIGTILTVSGTMSTVNCEKVIINPSVSMDGSTIINPLGLSTKSLGGGDWFYDDQTGEGQQGVTDGVGLNNIGLLVKIWGKVTSVDSTNKFFYVDDGSGSVKVSWDWQTSGQSIIPPNVGWTVSVSGISSIAADSARLLRVRSQGDIVLHDPQDTGNPTVAITSPAGSTWHMAANENHIVISGTATDAETGVVSVQVRITGGNWEQAVYDPATYTWSYDWQSPTAGTRYVYAKATDFAGNYTTTSKYVNVAASNPVVVYVKATGGNNSWDGLTWATAKATLGGTQGAIATAQSGQEIWVGEGTYVECITLTSGIGLYGGFIETETVREQRDWSANQTVIDGYHHSSVVTITNVTDPSATISGFTIRNGVGRASGSWDNGGGIYCNSANVTLANNIVRDNSAVGAGLFAFNSSLVVANNVFLNNTSGLSGGAIYYFTNCSGVITNNTIICNTAAACGGIYLNASSPQVSNNIIFSNTGGGMYKSGGSATFQTNDVFGNSGYDYNWTPVPASDIHSDPLIPLISSGDWHIQPNSPCVGTGTNSVVQSDWRDIDNEARKQPVGGTVDIGADESNGCQPTITFSCNPAYAETCEPVVVTVHVADWDGDPVADGTWVGLNIADGEITHVNGEEVSGPRYYGFTDDGDVTVTVMRSTEGRATLTATVARSCGEGIVSSDQEIQFFDESITFACDPPYGEPEESVVVTVHVAKWDGDPVGNVCVTFAITGGEITHVNGQEVTGPVYQGFTDANGDVTVTVTRSTPGVAILTATVPRSCGEGSVSRDRNVWFSGGPPVDLVFLIDVTGSTSQREQAIKDGIRNTVDYLYAQLQAQGRVFRVAGIKFSNYYPNLLDPSLPNSNGVLRDFDVLGDTTARDAFKTWVGQDWVGGGNEYQLDILMFAKDMAPSAIPGLYIALATDEDSDSSLDINDVAAALTGSGSIVFIDPSLSNLVSYYQPLAVNGGVIEESSLDTFTFPSMREAIVGTP